MSSLTRKAWQDVRAGGARSLLVAFALVLGLWGLGSVLVAYRILSHDLQENFLRTLPAHAVLTFEPASPLDLASVRSRANVESAELRDLALLRVEVRPDEWIPLWLYGVENFRSMELARVTSQEGAAIPPEGAMLIERNGRLISTLNTGVGARVRSQDRIVEIPVAGIVFDPAQAPATQDHFIYAYSDRATVARVSGEESGRRLVVRFRDVHTKADVERAAADLAADLAAPVAATGRSAVKVTVPAFLEHPHQWQLDTLLGMLGSIGLLAFLLSSVLVSQAVAALLAKQVRQIGILKAIGASRRQLAGIFSLYLAFFAVASGLVAIPLAILTGYGFSYFCAGILNVEILTTRLPGETLALLVLAALVLPFLFAGPTLAKASRISVRKALAGRRIERRSRVTGRTVMTVAATAMGVAIFSTGFNIRQSLFDFLATTRDSMRYDVQVVLAEPMATDAFSRVFAAVGGVERAEMWSGGRGVLQTRVAGTDDGVGIVALPLDSEMVSFRMRSGRWLAPSDAPEIVINQAALPLFRQPKVGQPLALRIAGDERRATLVGIVEEIDLPKVYLADTLYARWANPSGEVNTLLLTAKDRSFQGVMSLKRAVEGAIASSSLKVSYVMSQAERTKIIADHLNIILMVLLTLSFLVLWVSALGMASTTSITVLERTRELGVLRAIGATPERILGMLVAEGLATSAAGLVLGLILSRPLTGLAASFFGSLMLGEGTVLRSAHSTTGLVTTVAVSVLFGYLASRLPAAGAIRITIRRALAYE
ncbi:MAG: ABC transporter permease [Thermoanaerobaculia bacterium]